MAALASQTLALKASDARKAVENALAEEISIMLEERVVEDASQIDLAMMIGAGWPFALGGICGYLDYAGVSRRVCGKEFGVLG